MLVSHPETFVKGRGFERAKRLLGNGLLTAHGSDHQQRRRMAHAAFHRSRMPRYGAIAVKHAAETGRRWEDGRTVDVAREMHTLALAIAGEALFGSDLAPFSAEVEHALADALAPMDALISLVAPTHSVRRARRQLEHVVDLLIERRLQSRDVANDLLALLLASDSLVRSSREQLRDDAITFLLASHDTIANALTWAWVLLADNSNAGARMAAEVSEAFGGRMPTEADAERLVLTRAVMAETLRLYPPAWVIVRRARKDHRLGDTLIPTGTVVVASPFTMHRNPRFFTQSRQFLPARWVSGSPEAAQDQRLAPDRPRLAYFPFGAGSRGCIGETFAWTEGTLVLATLVKQWQLSRAGELPVRAVPCITLRPSGAVMATFVRK